jgi:hypothetical protein
MEAKPSHAQPRSNKQLHSTTDIQKQRRQTFAHIPRHTKQSAKTTLTIPICQFHSQEPLCESFILSKKSPTFGQLEVNIEQNMLFFYLEKLSLPETMWYRIKSVQQPTLAIQASCQKKYTVLEVLLLYQTQKVIFASQAQYKLLAAKLMQCFPLLLCQV